MSPKEFIGKENEVLIAKAIEEAEHQTSGEIRVHIESKCKEEVLNRAAWLFKKLKMNQTKDRNGVLIYLSVNDRKFAILGDSGINKVVPEGFWNEIKEMMIGHFSRGEFGVGLIHGIDFAAAPDDHRMPAEHDLSVLNQIQAESRGGVLPMTREIHRSGGRGRQRRGRDRSAAASGEESKGQDQTQDCEKQLMSAHTNHIPFLVETNKPGAAV